VTVERSQSSGLIPSALNAQARLTRVQPNNRSDLVTIAVTALAYPAKKAAKAPSSVAL